MNTERFMSVLAEQLSEIIPSGYRVTAGTDGVLWYSNSASTNLNGQVGQAGTYVCENLKILGDSENQSIVSVAVQALSELQDFISETTTNPWPGISDQPAPEAAIIHDELHLWYGNVDNPVLSCGVIPLKEIL